MPYARRTRPGDPRAEAIRLALTLIVVLSALAVVVLAGVRMTRGPAAPPGVSVTVLPIAGDAGDPARARAPVPPAQSPAVGENDVRALAERRGRALADADEEAFVADVDPAAPGLADEQRRLFRNLLRVPFDEAGYRLDAVAGAVAHPAGGDTPAVAADVTFHHRVAGADTATVAEGYRWILARTGPGGAPRIVAVTGTPYDGTGYRYLRDYPAPWDLDDVTVARRPHVVVLAGPSTAAGAERLADLAEAAAVGDLAGWSGPGDVARGFVLVPVADRERFYGLYGGRADQHGDEAGLTYALRAWAADGGSAGSFGGARIVVDVTGIAGSADRPDGADGTLGAGAPGPAGTGAEGDATRAAAALLRHEIAHALVTPLRRERPGTDQPLWVVEGFADWLAHRGTVLDPAADLRAAAARVRAGRFTGALPSDADLHQADPSDGAAAYQLAHLAIRHIAGLAGDDAVFAFVRAVYADPGAVDGALRDATGLAPEAFTAGWARAVRDLLG